MNTAIDFYDDSHVTMSLMARIPATLLAVLAVYGAFTICKDSAYATEYPARPVRMIVPSGAGANQDITARHIAQKLAEALGQPVVVDNRAGAGGTIGTTAAAKASPDGYTILYGNIPPMAVAPGLYRNLAYDPVKSFTAVARTTSLSLVLAVSATLPINSVPELVAYAKARPNQLNYASPGNGSLAHLSGVLLNNKAGLEVRHVPYNSVPQAFSEITSGAVAMIFYPYQGLVPMVQLGRVRLLATTGTRRTASLPAVPTMIESGVADFVIMAWEGLYVPAGTPKPIVDALYAAFASVATDPGFVSKLAAVGIDVDIAPPAVFAAFTRSEVERFRQLVALAGVKIE
jgi:tripartite-type tricarboxylate transporter receptor subunit TctC